MIMLSLERLIQVLNGRTEVVIYLLSRNDMSIIHAIMNRWHKHSIRDIIGQDI